MLSISNHEMNNLSQFISSIRSLSRTMLRMSLVEIGRYDWAYNFHKWSSAGSRMSQ